jgi:hypothetical protein
MKPVLPASATASMRAPPCVTVINCGVATLS